MARKRPKDDSPIVTGYVVLIDTREQLPYTFCGMQTDADQGCRPLAVRTDTVTLAEGDYALLGYPFKVAVERKSHADLVGTLGQGRERFERELERLATYDYAAVVVEASWHEILFAPPEHSALNPKTVHRSVIAWQQRYPRVHWWMAGSRRLGEITTLRILERYWRDHDSVGGGTLPCARK